MMSPLELLVACQGARVAGYRGEPCPSTDPQVGAFWREGSKLPPERWNTSTVPDLGIDVQMRGAKD